jgi:Zn-dependent protease
MPEIQLGAASASAPAAIVGAYSEASFRATMAVLRGPKRSSGALVLVASLGLFVLLQGDKSPRAIGLLVAVLLFHELGHYTGMRTFGYADVRMFFIPMFGAAVSGRRRDVAPWKEGVVLLLGPLPGIVAAFVIALRVRQTGADALTWRELTLSLVAINAFNLLPLAGLDGARLLQHVLFSRRRWLEIAFQVLAVLGMAWFAITTESVALGIVAYLMLVVLPYRWRLLGCAQRLRDDGRPLPFDARDLDDDAGHTLFASANSLLTRKSPKSLAAAMEQLIDAVHARSPSLGGSVALLMTWLLGFVLAFGTLVLNYAPSKSPAATQTLIPLVPQGAPGHRPGLRLGGDEEFQLKLR